VSRTNPRFPAQLAETSLDVDVARARRIRALAQLLDNAIPIPGTSWRFGFDAIVGLIPVAGDLIGGVLSGYIILEAARAEVPTLTLARMLVNVGIDTLVGAVPALGDLFDAAWKANIKNVALLERHLAVTAPATGEKRRVIVQTALALLVLVVIVAAGLTLGILVARLLWGLATG
jgi:uncharacterized protein DUF4112